MIGDVRSLKRAAYLGDGVYAGIDHYGMLVLATSDGVQITNRVVFERETLASLRRYLDRMTIRAVDE